jgi:glycosidase
MKAAAQLFQQHGVDGFRIDAIKHLNVGLAVQSREFDLHLRRQFLFGEWYQGNTSDPLYRDSYKFANKSGISMLDFPLNTAIRNVFRIERKLLRDRFSHLALKEATSPGRKISSPFIDNHDMARFLSVNNNNNRCTRRWRSCSPAAAFRASITAPNSTCTTTRAAAPILTTGR